MIDSKSAPRGRKLLSDIDLLLPSSSFHLPVLFKIHMDSCLPVFPLPGTGRAVKAVVFSSVR